MSIDKLLKKPSNLSGSVIGGIAGKELFCLNHGVPAWIAYSVGGGALLSQAKDYTSEKIRNGIASTLHPENMESYTNLMNSLETPVNLGSTALLITSGAFAGHYLQKQLLKNPTLKKGHDVMVDEITGIFTNTYDFLNKQYETFKKY